MKLSIIIPTLNEAYYISKTIKRVNISLSGQADTEIIVIDAGSVDGTPNIAKPLANRFFYDPGFTGNKFKSLNRGAELASGDVLMFLDADCCVPDKFDKLILEQIERKKWVGGAFRFKMDSNKVKYRALQLVNRVRYTFSNRYYGDQGIFCTRRVFEVVGGYPSEPIMEAAYFCRRIEKYGKIGVIKADLMTSTRRFEQVGFWRVLWYDIRVWIRFVLRMPTAGFAENYWSENEKRK